MEKRLLIINVYFAPQSFGGATIVAEAMASELYQKHGWQVLVLTTLSDHRLTPYSIKRYRAKGLSVIGVNTPKNITYEETYNNLAFTRITEKVIDLFCPTVVHVHCIQDIGCGYFSYIKKLKIPLVVTVHDCWWICERQFMINGQGNYCFQKEIDFAQCKYCVDDNEKAMERKRYLDKALNKIDLFLFPSNFQKNLYAANGIDKEKCITNKNGIKLPNETLSIRKNPGDRTLRFGFVGGAGPIKGADLIANAFRNISYKNYELIIVDAAKIVGQTWKDEKFWDIPGKVTFIPPYSTENMDEFYNRIDVLLFPSQWKESFGLVVREALARNVWVISTESGGAIEDIQQGINGQIVPLDGDYRKLKQSIIECLENDYMKEHTNPLKKNIRGISEQAEELSLILYDMSIRS